MTAARARKVPRSVTAWAEVEVEVDPAGLEEAGWVYLGDEVDATTSGEEVLGVVQRWHDEAHVGPWRWCREEPCRSLQGVV